MSACFTFALWNSCEREYKRTLRFGITSRKKRGLSEPTQQPLISSGLHLLPYGRLHLLIFQELHHVYLLTCLWIINLRAGGVALWPPAAIDDMLGAASNGWGVGAVGCAAALGVALEALLPAAQGCRQGRASDLNIYPGAAETQDTEWWRITSRQDAKHYTGKDENQWTMFPNYGCLC